MRVGTPLPQLDGAVEWLNEEVLNPLKEPRLTVIHFWALSCPACKANMPDVHLLRDKYASIGAQFIAIHTPRTPEDLNIDDVRRVASEIGITEPCAVDSLNIIGSRFQLSGMWPYYFLFAADGKMKRRGAGAIGLRLLTSSLAEFGTS